MNYKIIIALFLCLEGCTVAYVGKDTTCGAILGSGEIIKTENVTMIHGAKISKNGSETVKGLFTGILSWFLAP